MEQVLNQKEGWIVEFNEYGKNNQFISKSYKGEAVTKELLDYLVKSDEALYMNNFLWELVPNDEKEKFRDKVALGYDKFYFEKYLNGEIVKKLRIDVGDGNQVNHKDWDYLYQEIE